MSDRRFTASWGSTGTFRGAHSLWWNHGLLPGAFGEPLVGAPASAEMMVEFSSRRLEEEDEGVELSGHACAGSCDRSGGGGGV